MFFVQSSAPQITRANSQEMRARIVALLDEIAQCDESPDLCIHREAEKANERLKLLPCTQVLPLVLERLQTVKPLQDGSLRNDGYRLLATGSCWKTVPGAAEQLLEGLTESRRKPHGIVGMCAAALSQSQDKVIRLSAVNKLISQWDFPPGAAVGYSPEVTEILVRLASVIQGLGYFGKDAEIAINDIERVFRNDLLYFEYEVPNKDSTWTKTSIERDHQRKRRSGAGTEVKRSAILSILRIGGPERVLRIWDHADLLGRATLLWLFGPVCADHNKIKEAFYNNQEYTQHIRQLVVKSLESSSIMVRKAGINDLFFVFGDDVVVIRSPTDYELNPQIKVALEDMAANDPDEQLRQHAASSLAQMEERYLDRAVENILRKRKKDKDSRGR